MSPRHRSSSGQCMEKRKPGAAKASPGGHCGTFRNLVFEIEKVTAVRLPDVLATRLRMSRPSRRSTEGRQDAPFRWGRETVDLAPACHNDRAAATVEKAYRIVQRRQEPDAGDARPPERYCC